MKIFLVVLVTFFASASLGDIIKCTFTEPFYSVQYSMTQSRLTLTSPDGTSSQSNVSFQIINSGRFELRNSSNAVLMRLYLNFEGSDGMSDAVYPYRARWRPPGQAWMWGGCTSNYLHKTGGS